MHPLKDHGQVLDFEDYVRTRHATLLRCARRLVADPLDAQDLLQTALLRTYHRWEHIADKHLVDAYLRRVMINTRTEWWRARKLEELPTEHLPDAPVEDQAEQHSDRALLMDIIKTLPPQQLNVLVLRYWEQMSTDETAAALGMAPGTVKSTLHWALAQLRQELQHRDPDSLQRQQPALRAHRPATRHDPCAGRTASPLRTDTGVVMPPAQQSVQSRPVVPEAARDQLRAQRSRSPTRQRSSAGQLVCPASRAAPPSRARTREAPDPLARHPTVRVTRSAGHPSLPPTWPSTPRSVPRSPARSG
nr:SigE family RNA polymerase sigma factor [Streptomyces sp. RLB1-33]